MGVDPAVGAGADRAGVELAGPEADQPRAVAHRLLVAEPGVLVAAAEQEGDGFDDGDIDLLAGGLPRVARVQRRQQPQRGVQAGLEVGLLTPGFDRLAVGVAGDPQIAAGGVGGQLGRAPAGFGAMPTVGGDGADLEVGMGFAQGVGIEVVVGVADQRVGVGEQALKQPPCGGCSEVEAQRALAAVEVQMQGGVGAAAQG